MSKYIGILFFMVLFNACSYGQGIGNSKKCNCSIFIDTDYKGKINLLKEPDGKVIKAIQHNFKDEDYIILDVKEWAGAFLYVEASYSIGGLIAKGWIKKSKELSIYARAYTGSLVLYNSPGNINNKSFVLKGYIPDRLQVSGCNGEWLKVHIENNKKMYQGWLAPDMQCANPYTTCN
jgi:hypothetical protein